MVKIKWSVRARLSTISTDFLLLTYEIMQRRQVLKRPGASPTNTDGCMKNPSCPPYNDDIIPNRALTKPVANQPVANQIKSQSLSLAIR